MREAAAEAQVTVRIADDLPRIEVDAAAVELCVTNYLGNAISIQIGEAPALCRDQRRALKEWTGTCSYLCACETTGWVSLNPNAKICQTVFPRA